MQAAPEVPVACSLSSTAIEQRLAWIRRMTRRALLSHRLDGGTLRLSYRQEARTALESIVAKERECCPFLTFELGDKAGTVELTIRAPVGLETDAGRLFGQFLPDSPEPNLQRGCACLPGACG